MDDRNIIWLCNFKIDTGRGSTFNCASAADEFQLQLVSRNAGWFNLQPKRYQYVNGIFGEYPYWEFEQAAVIEAEQAALAALQARIDTLEAEREAAGIHKYTPEQIKEYIDNAFATATTAPQIKTVVQEILKKMAVYTLR